MTRILYVEDNEDNVFMLTRRLRKRGYEVIHAGNGQAALDQLAGARPALVLMDLSLPVLDGWETTRRLKSNPATADIPVIALSAHAMSGDREKALASGCDDFETKPIDFKRLLSKMETLLGDGSE
jgi:two-component system cell cycle response regulator DivK